MYLYIYTKLVNNAVIMPYKICMLCGYMMYFLATGPVWQEISIKNYFIAGIRNSSIGIFLLRK